MDKKSHNHHSCCSNATDPLMAKQMEKEMRIGFIVSLLLTIPVVLYSFLGQKFWALICRLLCLLVLPFRMEELICFHSCSLLWLYFGQAGFSSPELITL